MKNTFGIVFLLSQILVGLVTSEENVQEKTGTNEKPKSKSTIIANDIAEALIASLGINIETHPNKHLQELRDKLYKIDYYTFDQEKYMEILHNETIGSNLTHTKFYEALNMPDDLKYLTETNPSNIYLKLKQKMNRDDILAILKKHNITSYGENGDDDNLDKLIVDPHSDKSNFSGSKFDSNYWDPKPELVRRQDMASGRRLYKGTRAFINHFPFMASVHVMGRFFCGGVLYWHDLVLTSASCLQLLHNNRFFRENPNALNVRIGSNHSRIGGELIPALEVYFHPGYNSRNLLNNIAAIRLERHIKFTQKRVPKLIAISKKRHQVPINIPLLLLGWGVTRRSKKMSYEPVFLQQKMVPIYPNIMCKDIYGDDKFRMNTMFCAGSMTEGDGACDHDAGGPAIFNGRLVGIISYGTMGCGVKDAPTVFTHVGYFSDWIKEVNDTHPAYLVAYARTTTTGVYHMTFKTTASEFTKSTPHTDTISPIWSTPQPYRVSSPVNNMDVEPEKIPSPADFVHDNSRLPEHEQDPYHGTATTPVSIWTSPAPSPPPKLGRQRHQKRPRLRNSAELESESDDRKEFKFHFGSKV